MKGFKLNISGDVVIENNRIQMIEGTDLLRQTVQSVLGTNKGEWTLNPNEGINFKNLLGKQKTIDTKKNNTVDVKRYYEKEIEYIRQSETELIGKLQKRLDGDE